MLMHFGQFWYKMMFAELMGHHEVVLCSGATVSPQDGAAFIQYYFSHLWVVVVYLIWYAALWFHLSHGIWSAMHTLGQTNNLWLSRWECIGKAVSTLIFLGFAAVTIFFYVNSL